MYVKKSAICYTPFVKGFDHTVIVCALSTTSFPSLSAASPLELSLGTFGQGRQYRNLQQVVVGSDSCHCRHMHIIINLFRNLAKPEIRPLSCVPRCARYLRSSAKTLTPLTADPMRPRFWGGWSSRDGQRSRLVCPHPSCGEPGVLSTKVRFKLCPSGFKKYHCRQEGDRHGDTVLRYGNN